MPRSCETFTTRFQRGAEQQYLAVSRLRRLRNRADAPDIGGEGGDGHAAFSTFDDLAQAFGNLMLGGRHAVAQRVGAVAHQRQHALFTDRAETRLVRQRPKRRGLVDLPVAGVDDIAQRRANDERHRLRNGVVDANSFDFERTDIDAVACLEDRHRNFGARALIGALGFQHAAW